MTGRISQRPFNNHVRHKPLQTKGGNHRGYPICESACNNDPGFGVIGF
jgi:hypothetical protein